MDLETFITNTLVGIEKGVKEANKKSDSKSFTLTPKDSRVEFDVAVQVTANNEKGVSGKAGLGVSKILQIAEVGVEGKEGSETSNTSRIKFKVKLERVVQ